MTCWKRIPRWLRPRAPSRRGRAAWAVAGTATGVGSFICSEAGGLPTAATAGGLVLSSLAIVLAAIPELLSGLAMKTLYDSAAVLSTSNRDDARERLQVLADLIVGIKLVENGIRPEGPESDPGSRSRGMVAAEGPQSRQAA